MKTKLSLTALLLALVLGFAGCAKDEMDTTGDIAGVITDAKTNQVLAGANITLSPLGRSFTTGSDGRYSFSDIEVGTYTVQASKSGYSTNQRQVEVIAGEVSSLDIPLTPATSVLSLSIAPEALDFGSATSALTLTLTNKSPDRSIINYTLASSNEWLLVSKQKGQFSTTEVITVSVDRDGLSEGDYDGSLTLSVEGQSTVIPVTMSIIPKAKPTVSMTAIEEVTSTGATLRGAIVSTGSSSVVHHGFVWGTTEEPTLENGTKCDLGDAQTARNFSYTASELNPSTTYYVRAYAENDEGISYSAQQRFTTKEHVAAPSVETGSASNVQQNQADIAGTLVALGSTAGVTAHGHVWSTHANPTLEDNRTNLGSRTQTGGFTSTLTNLEPNTTYHVRAYATNEGGTSYGSDATFTTRADMVSRGLQAYYTFDDQTADNQQQDALHGFLQDGTYISDTPSGSGKAVAFGQGGKMSIGSSPLENRQNWTISMWIKDFGGGVLYHTQKDENHGGPTLAYDTAGKVWYRYGWNNYTVTFPVSLSSYQTGQWMMLTIVTGNASNGYAGKHMLYVNGRQLASYDATSDMRASSGSVFIGGSISMYSTYGYSSSGYPTDAFKVDNVRIYNVALTDAEVKQIYDFERQQ